MAERKINRREFLKLIFPSLLPLIFPSRKLFKSQGPTSWPYLLNLQLPRYLQDILSRSPASFVDEKGLFNIVEAESAGIVRVVQTQWNIDRGHFLDKLRLDHPWAIVLHWYGEGDEFDGQLSSYLRGFDSLRTVEEYITRTSAHFLVGDEAPRADSDDIGIIQTQVPYEDGTPTLASHIYTLDYLGHLEGNQYFVRSLYQMSFENPKIHSVLQDWFNGPEIDPNDVSIAIEITGKEFNSISGFPSQQKIANTLSLVAALMKRYKIKATALLGHHEIDLRKADPGKEFIGFMRLLIGLKALQDQDEVLLDLVFGQFLNEERNYQKAVEDYFHFVWNFMLLVMRPDELYQWEAASKYWFVQEQISADANPIRIASRFTLPVSLGSGVEILNGFDPEIREGLDFVYRSQSGRALSKKVRLAANGICLYVNNEVSGGKTRSTIFMHRLPTGAQIISSYSYLSSVESLKTGQEYSIGNVIGHIESREVDFFSRLRFSIAYSAAWETDLKSRPYVPVDVNREWIERFYLDPIEFIEIQNVAAIYHRKLIRNF